MSTYSFYLLKPEGTSVSAGHHEFSGDFAALIYAELVLESGSIEVREGVRILCRVHPDGAMTG